MQGRCARGCGREMKRRWGSGGWDSGYVSWVVMAVQWVAVRERKKGGEREGKEKNGEGDGDGVSSGGAAGTGGRGRKKGRREVGEGRKEKERERDVHRHGCRGEGQKRRGKEIKKRRQWVCRWVCAGGCSWWVCAGGGRGGILIHKRTWG